MSLSGEAQLVELKIPRAMRPRVAKMVAITDELCAACLDREYAELGRELVARLARKRPSPLVTVVGARPLSGAGVLLIPGIPLLVAGQLWAMATLNARGALPSRRLPARTGAKWWALPNPRTLFFPGLSDRAAYAVMTVFFLGWLAGITAIPNLLHGNPEHGTAGCPWPLGDGGVITCVSHAAYLRAGAAFQRFGASVFLGFFVAHLA